MLAPAFLRSLPWLAAWFLAVVPGAFAGDKEDAAAAVDAFYQEFIAKWKPPLGNGETAAWVAQSPRLTPELKAAYAKWRRTGIKEEDGDPILNIQEPDPKGVRVVKTKAINGKEGVLEAEWVTPGTSEESLFVHVRKVGGKWLLHRVNRFGGPVSARAAKYLPERGSPD